MAVFDDRDLYPRLTKSAGRDYRDGRAAADLGCHGFANESGKRDKNDLLASSLRSAFWAMPRTFPFAPGEFRIDLFRPSRFASIYR
ncbi:protein of unknown function [Methylocaldum szegediense]|uniref:Uncharacterized protein n=1 Tax=Methylocaldum szegediense TaxID=73780 RepID=A0ABM9HZ46_9GAMM|nr:protein of unknown function [Methylocaldum szegediense]